MTPPTIRTIPRISNPAPLEIPLRALLSRLRAGKLTILSGEGTHYSIYSLLALKLCYRLQLSLASRWRLQSSPAAHAFKRCCSWLIQLVPTGNSDAEDWKRVIAAEISTDTRSGRPIEQDVRSMIPASSMPDATPGIAMVCYSLGAGGAEQQMVRLCRRLVESGESVIVHAEDLEGRNGFFAEDLRAGGITVRRIDLSRRAEGQLPRIDVTHYCRTRALLTEFRESRPQIVHAWMDQMGASAAFAAVLAGVERVIIDCRSLAPTHFSNRGLTSIRAIYRALSSLPNVVFVNNSHAGAADYRRWLDLPALPIRVIRNAVSNSDLIRRDTDPQGLTVGGIMRLTDEKVPHRFVDIAAACIDSDPRCRFIICGDGPLRDSLVRRIAREGLSEKIECLGEVRDVMPVLAQLDVLLITSRVEGTPNSLLEAQVAGIPVVAPAVGGIPECISPANHPFLFGEDESPQDIAIKIHQARGLSLEALEASRQFTLETFDGGQQTSAYRRIYHGSLSTNP
jgi:glycosyltransferase involved in cell wall biosynthesis